MVGARNAYNRLDGGGGWLRWKVEVEGKRRLLSWWFLSLGGTKLELGSGLLRVLEMGGMG